MKILQCGEEKEKEKGEEEEEEEEEEGLPGVSWR